MWLAGAWLRERCARLRAAGDDALTAANAARTELVTALADRAEPTRTAAMLAVTVDTLLSPAVDRAGTGHAAVLVTRCLDRLSPEGVDLEFVQSRELTRALAAHLGPLGDALALDSAEIDRALALAERHGLLTVDWGAAGVVRAHRAECAAVAALADPVEAARIAALVLDALAEFAPRRAPPTPCAAGSANSPGTSSPPAPWRAPGPRCGGGWSTRSATTTSRTSARCRRKRCCTATGCSPRGSARASPSPTRCACA
ncbi:hypothetical protein ACFQV2_29850 [Actinokineospora soli]|uniref:Uncharacterized protein n=1 Tax=Actinokineospora soli TaxID=1048753 RepID=A0ABW2TT48_9PSEU